MLQQFQLVWSTLADIASALPAEIVLCVSFIFCGIGVVGFFRSF